MATIDGVHQARRGDRLVVEAGPQDGVVGQVAVEQLHRDRSVEHLVGGLPHLGHAAARQMAVEAVAAGEEAAGARSGGVGHAGAPGGRITP